MQIQENWSRADNYAANSARAAKDIRYLVIHEAGNHGDTAKARAEYAAQRAAGISAHYYVDVSEIWNSVPDTCTAWHCGTRGAYFHPWCRNRNSIGIALCSQKNAMGHYVLDSGTVDRGTALARLLMARYGIPKERVLRHYDVTHENCPEPFVRDWQAWEAFKNKLHEEEKA